VRKQHNRQATDVIEDNKNNYGDEDGYCYQTRSIPILIVSFSFGYYLSSNRTSYSIVKIKSGADSGSLIK